ncbi:MAG: aspartate-semialdehyde dehydrogenase [Gammaproteobacteria bacterium]|nr:aspartate-semialdehyde dehydrogenase [Gammaproteobacteria bacterium]
MKRLGFVGWRGMVGSVLLARMREEGDLEHVEELVLYSTSQAGQPGPELPNTRPLLADAIDLDSLSTMDAIISCQGGDYTQKIHAPLRDMGWQGYWLDAASTLRMSDNSTIILDPLNQSIIRQNLAKGQRDFIGGNCTVSLMLMALHGLFKENLVEWITAMTYQAISGGGAQQMRELLIQMGEIHEHVTPLLRLQESSILDIDSRVNEYLNSSALTTGAIGSPLANNLLPWIDIDLDNGIGREEWKGYAETNKILGRENNPIPIESTCVRVGTFRCHSQAFTIALSQDVGIDDLADIMGQANQWVKVIPNNKQDTLQSLTPAAVSGSMDIAVGRIRKTVFNSRIMTVFTVGDQLLWGAAEPLRRMLGILSEYQTDGDS